MSERSGLRHLLIVALVVAAPAIAQPTPLAPTAATASQARTITPIDAGWRFQRADVAGASAADFDDARWPMVTLPHSFNAADGDDGGSFYRGPSWYRRGIDIAQLPPRRRVWIQFDGAALATDVYVNGRSVGRHEGGHARFRFDITDALKTGRNMIAVKVDNSRVPQIAPLGGDFTLFGGLYRRVFLVEANEVHIDLADHGGPGVYVDTAGLDDRHAKLGVRVLLRNDGKVAQPADLVVEVKDAAGLTVATARRRVRLPAHSGRPQTLPLDVPDPHRWNGRADPYLYTVTARLDGTNADAVTVPLGLRTMAFDPQRGFLLNGRAYPLHGVNLFHSGRPGRGLAVTDAEVSADMQILDDLGVTAVRLVHFQHPEAAYEEADRRGIVLWTEIGLNGVVDPGTAFQADVVEQMRELVRQNSNHPSVALWGIGNEVYASTPDVTRVLKAVAATARAEDPSRPTVYAHCCQSDDSEKAGITDVIGFNRYFGWYPGQAGTIGEWADAYHAAHPRRAFAVSEYGAGASIRHQQLPLPKENVPESGWHPEQAQTRYHEDNWRDLAARPYLFGTFVWVAFDLASDGRHEGDRPGINDKGLVSYDRATRKDAYYLYQAHWSQTPMLHIVDRRLDRRTGSAVEVRAFTNQPGATLTVNGRALGYAAAVDRVVRWADVPLAMGANTVSIAASATGEVRDSVVWTRTLPSATGITGIPTDISTAAPAKPEVAPPGQ